MTDDNNFSGEHLDKHTAEFLTNFFQQVISGLAAQIEDRIKTLESSVEQLEQQIATLVLSYGEQAVFTEALVSQIAFGTEESKKAFHDTLRDSRKNMLEVMQSASKGFLADDAPGVASALTDMATEKLSDTES